MAITLLSMPFTIYAQADQKQTAPSISQTLIPEGDFALKLAPALKLGTPSNEAQAEDMLTSAGIAPKNGWIADYPLTPNIVGELQSAVVTAADSKKLPMEKDDALKVFQGITTEFGLAIAPGSGQYAENQASEYVQPQEINNYYYDEGPPVVTYYAPPWDYYYLYDWVPYPFWWTGFFFPGFFILNDFDTFVFIGHHHHRFRITNHFFNHRTHAFGRVDPVNHSWTTFSRTTAFNSTATRNAASSIFRRSEARTTFARGTPSASPRGERGMTGNRVSSFGGREGAFTNNRGSVGGGRTFTNSRSFATGGGMNHHSLQSSNRSFSAPSSRGSFSGGHSFSGFSAGHSSSGFSGGHSFSGFSGGHSSSGFSGGHSFSGFSGGHSFSGFSGGHSFGGGGFHGGGGGHR